MINIRVLFYFGLALVLVGVVGYAWGRYKTQAKIEIQEKQIVTKETEVIYREIKKADGTVIKETVTKDTSTKENDKSNKVTMAKVKNKLGVIGLYDFNKKEAGYGIAAERRIGDSPFFAGGFVTNTKTVGLSLSLEF